MLTLTIKVSCFPPCGKGRHGFCARRGGVWLRRTPLCSGSSQSLSRKAGLLNFCSYTQDRFVMVLALGHPTSLRYIGQSAHLHAIKILHRDNLPAKVPGSCSGLTSGKTPARQALR